MRLFCPKTSQNARRNRSCIPSLCFSKGALESFDNEIELTEDPEARKDMTSMTPQVTPGDATGERQLPVKDHCSTIEAAMHVQTQMSSLKLDDDILDAALFSDAEFIPLTMPQTFADASPRPEFTPFTVPHLCASSPYDYEGFWTYPRRCGWIIHAKDTMCHVLCPPGTCNQGRNMFETRSREPTPLMLSRVDNTPILPSDKAAFLQAWLFFGVLHEVSSLCGLKFDLKEFVSTGDVTVSTARLNGLPRRWFVAAKQKNRLGDKPTMEQILRIARQARMMLTQEINDDTGLTDRFKYTYSECRLLHSLDIVVRIVGLYLLVNTYLPGFRTTEKEGWGQQRILRSLEADDTEGMDQLSNYALDELADKGWCESEISLFAPDELAFAALLDRPRIRDHSACGDQICGAYQTDEATYKTRHVHHSCDCQFIGVGTDVLVDALHDGRIPKVIVTENLELKVVADNGYPYIALSHVWADGLGNPKANALPKCELQRLRDYVNALSQIQDPELKKSSGPSPVAFWMDTLCIPVDASARQYRKKAIQLLGKTFHEANAVLVLDHELTIAESLTTSFLELGMRILCGGWMKRLWTLQEATLASESHGVEKIYFQMRDGPFLYQKYGWDRKLGRGLDQDTTEIQAEERTLLLERGVMLLLGSQIPSIRGMREMRPRWSPFQVIYSALEHRTTSRVEDVPLCITSLVGKDVTAVLSATTAEDRMAQFYILMREIPMGILWSERPEKLSLSPFRWAPFSINACKETTYMGWEDGVCDAYGLHARVGGFIFHKEDIGMHIEKSRDTGAIIPRIFGINLEEPQEICLVRPTRRSQMMTVQQDMALLIRPDDKHNADPNGTVVVVERTVEYDDEKDGSKSVEFVCRVIGYVELLGRPKTPSSEVTFRGKLTSSDQRWRVT